MPCCPGDVMLRRSRVHLVTHFSPLRKSLTPSRRQRRQTGSWGLAMWLLRDSDAAPLGRAATVVRDGRDVGDRRDLQAGGLQAADCGLAAGAGALDEDLDGLEAVLHGAPRRLLGRHLGGERRAL